MNSRRAASYNSMVRKPQVTGTQRRTISRRLHREHYDHPTKPPPFDDALVDKALHEEESYTFDCKRLKDKLAKILETVVAFANSDGGVIGLGLEDPEKAHGRDRVYGVQENPMNWDELRRLMVSRITESALLVWKPHEVGCTCATAPSGRSSFCGFRRALASIPLWTTVRWFVSTRATST